MMQRPQLSHHALCNYRRAWGFTPVRHVNASHMQGTDAIELCTHILEFKRILNTLFRQLQKYTLANGEASAGYGKHWKVETRSHGLEEFNSSKVVVR